MRLPAITLLAFALCGPWPIAQAEIFQWRDDTGRVHYGDAPPEHTPVRRLDDQAMPAINSGPAAMSLPRRVAAPRVARTPRSTASGRITLEQCVAAKRKAVRAERKRPIRGDPELESWLWKNCRGYAHELRKVSQSMM